MPTISGQLAAFAARTRYEDLPPEVTRDVRLRLLDSLGLAISGSTEPFAPPMLNLARRWYRPGPCTAIGLCGGLSAPAAGLVNGTLVHGQDYDDTHIETLIHASACIAPAAFALAEEHRLSGREMVALAAVGYEVEIRIGLGACPGARMHERGFHTTTLAGAIAAAAMAARARGGDEELMRNAMGLGVSIAAGLRESSLDGTFAKGIQPGWAVQAGLWAAEAAAEGITGPIRAFEGRRGLYASHAGLDLCHLDRVTADLGRQWEFLNIDYKLYPLCHHLQAPAEAALSIREEAGLTQADQVATAEVELSDGQYAVYEPRAEKLAPSTLYSFKFSLPYSVAVALSYGSLDTPSVVRGLADPAVQRLATRVTPIPFANPDFPTRMPGRVAVATRDGRVFERRYPSPPGRYGRPVGDEEIEAKFRRNAVPVVGTAIAEETLGRMREVDSLASVGFLGSQLAGS